MLVQARPRPSAVYQPVPYYKRQRTESGSSGLAESPRSVPPAVSSYTQELPPRGPSPAASIYPLSCSSSVASASSFNSRDEEEAPKKLSPPLTPSWLTRAPRTVPLSNTSPTPAVDTLPETPMDVPEAELRRRQLDKATRLLGETVPIELVFHPHSPPLKSFSDLMRHSTEEKRPRDMTVPVPMPRRPRKLTRRASLTLSVITSKFRAASAHGHGHSRNSSQDSSSSSPSSPPELHIPHQHPDLAPISPITFAFPRLHTPSRAKLPAEEVPVIEIGSGVPSHAHGCDSDSSEEDEEEEKGVTPVRTHPSSHTHSFSDALPRSVPLPPSPSHGHAHSHSEDLYGTRPDTPFCDYRPDTPFLSDPSRTGPLGPVSRKERRGEQGWSGEWNQPDMRHVLHKLRTLK